ncbi:hypothetical protein D9M68_584080 [compost metagenome]
MLVRVVHQQALDRQHALEDAVVIHHEEFVGVAGQFLEPTQIAQHHFQGHIVADGDHLEVHQRADLVLLVGQHGANALALLRIEGFHQLVDDVARQFRREVGQLVRVHFLGGGEQLVIVHVGDQRLTDGVGYFEEDVAVALGLDQLPDGQTLVERQGFEDVGDVGRVQLIELALQLDQVLPVDEVLDEILVLALLTMGQVFHQLVAMQQIDYLGQAVLQALLRLLGFYFSHIARSTPSGRARQEGSENHFAIVQSGF